MSLVKKYPLVCIFAVAVLVRVVFLLIFPLPDQIGGDFELYQRIADSIIAEGNFGGEPQKTYGSPSISPGWAFFLAGWEFFFGKSVISLVSASVLLGGLLSVGVYMLADLFFKRRAALIAGMVSVLWPVFIIQTFSYGSSLLLYTTVLLWSVLLWVYAMREGRALWSACSGVLLGFAMLVDAIAFFIPLIFLIWALLFYRSRRSMLSILVFFIGISLVLAPWAYRNTLVATQMGVLDTAPIISKGELKQIAPERLLFMTKLVGADGVLLSGLSKIYVFPYNISALDHRPVETEAERIAFSYKERLLSMMQGENIELSDKERIVLVVKIIITLLHWLLLTFAAVAIVFLMRMHQWSYPVLIILLAGYVTAAVIGFGSLAQDDFQSISGPNSFLFPLVPLFIILASFSLMSLYEKIRARKAVASWLQ
jgi:uncharacterized integral membrane protein